MKKILFYILMVTTVVSIFTFLPLQANAQEKPSIAEKILSNPLGIVGYFGGQFIDNSLKDKVVAPLAQLALTLMSLLLWVAGSLMNAIIEFTVVNMRENLTAINGINVAWSALRDLANITFIFLLLYAAFRLILGLDEGGGTKKIVFRVILIALVLNFSLFFTKVVIDAGNIVALGFYRSVSSASTDETIETSNKFAITGISGAFVRPLGLTDFFSAESFRKVRESSDTSLGLIVIGLAGSILLFITAFVFLAATVLFIVRYLVLIMLMVLSPLAFVSFAFPNTDSHFKKWWSALVDQSFFPALFMILIWVSIIIFNSKNFLKLGKGFSWAELFVGNNGQPPSSDAVGLLINFALVIGFLIFAIVVSKSMASKVGHGVGNLIGKLQTGVGAATFGAAGYLGRNTIGRAANAAAQSEWLKNRAKSSPTFNLIRKAGLKTADSSFDARASRIGKATTGATGSFGDAPKGGYAERVKEKVKAEKKYAETFATGPLEVTRKTAPYQKAIDSGNAYVGKINNQLNALERDLRDIESNPADPKLVSKKQDILIEIDRLRKEKNQVKADLETPKQTIKRIRDNIAENDKTRKDQYASSLSKRRILRLGYVGRANKEAAAAIRAEKSTKEKFVDTAKKLANEEADENTGTEKAPETGSSSDTDTSTTSTDI